MRHRHVMPFGAQHEAEATRFRLWAPACPAVALELGREGARSVKMQRRRGGWHEAEVEGVKAGEAYAFRVRRDLQAVPDPASRHNPWDVTGPSVVVDPHAYEWRDESWRGRPWHEAVVYELHVGTFTPEGTFAAAATRLDHLARTGVTAVELMPLADFRGRRNWGYDGVLPFAPDSAYGTPDELKAFVDAAHARGLMVLLDVVYNHFGPEGNFLREYAPQFFNAAHRTPWGDAINFDGEHARNVRSYFVHNALYWLEEFRLDGLRLDAVHAIADDSPEHIVSEIARAVDAGPGRERAVHLVLENEHNETRLLERGGRPLARAQWNDDAHHAYHVLATGETDGYYQDYAERPAAHLARTLAEGFAYQGEPSRNRKGATRGERSAHLPLEAFVCFLQNHDQVGNRALGERLVALAAPEALELATATLLLAPSVPLLFMGEEFGARTPFLYFCDYEGDLARAVRDGRRCEFSSFTRFRSTRAQATIPDPNDEATFRRSRLDWSEAEGAGKKWLELHRALLALRAREITPRLAGGAHGTFDLAGDGGIAVDWRLGDGSLLHLRANFGCAAAPLAKGPGRVLHAVGRAAKGAFLAPWSGTWTLEAG